jgi:NAD(P)-dependent dehydrogenase (short-subunit alcohol dehydrogenase family)
MEKAFSLSGKRILVTGAASGVGREFATLAAADGASLSLLDINKVGLEDTKRQLNGAASHTFTVDLTDWPTVQQAVKNSIDALGGLDAVCNIAGWDSPGRFWEQPLDLWRKIVEINLWSPMHVCRAVVPYFMERRAGRIVNVSSDAGRVGSKGETVYAAAKAGVLGLTKSLAREMAPYGVTVNSVCPGPTRTPLLAKEAEDNPKLMEKLIRAVPLGRVGEPRDQALAIAFLASDASAYITGQVLSVSGGLTMVG